MNRKEENKRSQKEKFKERKTPREEQMDLARKENQRIREKMKNLYGNK